VSLRRASSFVSSFAADLRPGSFSEIDLGERRAVVVAHDEAGFRLSTDQGGGSLDEDLK
jgi:hypothetical protein